MTVHTTTSHHRFTRNADKALLGGVCAGLADYFGFNLRATRVIFLIVFFVATPFPLIAYIAIVLLVPAKSPNCKSLAFATFVACKPIMSRKERRQAAEEEKQEAAEAYEQRRRSLDERLARVEKYVTSSRYSLDREFRNL